MDEKLILVIDDSQFLCTMLKKSLDSVGYNTLVAYTMEEGMRLFEQSMPDLVLLDINLPDMPGPEACKIIKANPQYSGTSIILMSASYEEYIKNKVIECAANGYIKKPFSPSSILRWVKDNANMLFQQAETTHALSPDGEIRQYTLEDLERPRRNDTRKQAPPLTSPAPPPPPRATHHSTTRAQGAPTLEQIDGKGRTIVITDDSTFLCAILKDTLEKVGFTVHTFSNIRDTGYFLKNNEADLMFLDVNLPDISGDRACAIIKESPRTKSLPIILISSAREDQLRRLVASSGANGYIIKPFTPLNVLEWMKRNLSTLFGRQTPTGQQVLQIPPPAQASYGLNDAEPQNNSAPQQRPSLSTPPPPPPPQRSSTGTAPNAGQTQGGRPNDTVTGLESDYQGPTEGEINILLNQLSSPLKEVRLDATYTLGEFRVHRAVDRLIDLLYDEDYEIRGEAAWALGEIRDTRALQPILNLLAIKNKWLRDRAVEALGKLGDERALPPIMNILKSRDDELRIAVIKALAGISNPRTRGALEELLYDRNEEVAANARWALQQLDNTLQ